MRLFVAIDLPDDVKARLSTLRTDVPGARWVERSALHLTLRFLGDGIDPIRLTPIRTALESVRAAPFDLTVRGVGRFPPGDHRPARVLWAGVAPQPALTALHTSIEDALSRVNFPPDDRPYNAHITLARLKDGATRAPVGQFLAAGRDFAAGTFTVTVFHLMSSILSPDGPRYQREAAFSLTN